MRYTKIAKISDYKKIITFQSYTINKEKFDVNLIPAKIENNDIILEFSNNILTSFAITKEQKFDVLIESFQIRRNYIYRKGGQCLLENLLSHCLIHNKLSLNCLIDPKEIEITFILEQFGYKRHQSFENNIKEYRYIIDKE